MSESHRLPGKPSRQTLYTWTRVGVVVSWLPDGYRLRLPTFSRNRKRFTTLAAYNFWMEQQQEPLQ